MIEYAVPGDHRGRKVNERQLHDELAAAGVEVIGVGLVKDENGATVSVRLHLAAEPDVATRGRIDAALAGHQPERPRSELLGDERVDALRAKRRAGQDLTPAERQEVLDLLLGV